MLMMLRNDRFHVDGLTGLRGLAACWVLCLHYTAGLIRTPVEIPLGFWRLDVTPFLTMGWIGVDIFFVLSGFLLAYPIVTHLRERFYSRVELGKYARRRLLRVMPAYLALIFFILVAASKGLMPIPTVASVATHLVMQHHTTYVATDMVPLLWTMPVEFDFYLFLPLLVYPLVRGISPVVFAVMAAGIAFAFQSWVLHHVWVLHHASDVVLIHHLPARLQEFGGGIAAAALLERRGRLLARYREALFVAGLAGLVASVYLVASRFDFYSVFADHWIVYVFRPVLTIALMCLMMGLALESIIGKKLFANGVILYLGTISYSIYLWHTVPLLGRFPSVLLAMTHSELRMRLLAVLITLAIASTSYFAIERPFQKLAHLRQENQDAVWRSSRYGPFIVLLAGGLLIMLFTVYLNAGL